MDEKGNLRDLNLAHEGNLVAALVGQPGVVMVGKVVTAVKVSS